MDFTVGGVAWPDDTIIMIWVSFKEFDPEEDEPTLEAAWPHLQVIYMIIEINVKKYLSIKCAKFITY